MRRCVTQRPQRGRLMSERRPQRQPLWRQALGEYILPRMPRHPRRLLHQRRLHSLRFLLHHRRVQSLRHLRPRLLLRLQSLQLRMLR